MQHQFFGPFALLLPWLACCCFAQSAGLRADVRVDTEEADAVLAFLNGRDDGTRLWAAEGYLRLKKREAEMGRAFTDDEFGRFLSSAELKLKKEALQVTLSQWKKADMRAMAEQVRSYLPSSAGLRSTVYIVIKPRSNSFVYELSKNPAIFLYLDPEVTKEQFENTIAHELHHVGLASVVDTSGRGIAQPSDNLRQAVKWIGAFGEGLAMLAAAGGPGVHPHQYSSMKDRMRWDRDLKNAREDMRSIEAFLLDTIAGKLDENQQREKGMSFFGTQGPWYTVGWMMSATVEKAMGRRVLIDCMIDLRQLLFLYNDTVNESQPRWSNEFLKALSTP